MTTVSFYRNHDSLLIMSAEDVRQFKSEIKSRPVEQLRYQKSVDKLKDLTKAYRAWMHANNGAMPSERTVASFENLTRPEKIDLIVRLKSKAMKGRRS